MLLNRLLLNFNSLTSKLLITTILICLTSSLATTVLAQKTTHSLEYYAAANLNSSANETAILNNDDSFGLFAQLQQGVKKIIVFVNTDIPISGVVNSCSDFPPLPNQIDDGLFQFFGFETDYFYENQVFKTEDLSVVYNGLCISKKENKPLMTTTYLTTVQNDKWNIPQGQNVEILWVYNEISHEL